MMVACSLAHRPLLDVEILSTSVLYQPWAVQRFQKELESACKTEGMGSTKSDNTILLLFDLTKI